MQAHRQVLELSISGFVSRPKHRGAITTPTDVDFRFRGNDVRFATTVIRAETGIHRLEFPNVMQTGPATLTPLAGIPIVREGDDVARLVGDAIDGAGIALADFDIVVVTQKIVSKAEGRHVRLADVEPSPRAIELAASLDKDPRMVEVVLGESSDVVAHGHGVLIAEHRSGHVMANAGVDRSNVGHSSDNEAVLLLPLDPDASAASLHGALEARFGCRLAVVISDSIGRPWRQGVVGIAIGAAGLPSLTDLRGAPDLFGVPLKVTLTGFADQIASAANLVAGEAAEGVPAVHVRGLAWSATPAPARALVRERESDLFR